MTDIDIEAIRKRAEAATEGPWKASDWQLDDGLNKTTIEAQGEPSTWWPGGFSKLRIADTSDGDNPLPDADFIAHARTDVPDLLSHIAAQDAVINKFGQAILDVADGAVDEGDRAYFGSTNDLDRLKELRQEYFERRFLPAYRAQKEKKDV